MAKTNSITGTFGIDANNQKVSTGKTKRKPKFAHGVELKNKVQKDKPPKRKPKFQAGADLKKAIE